MEVRGVLRLRQQLLRRRRVELLRVIGRVVCGDARRHERHVRRTDATEDVLDVLLPVERLGEGETHVRVVERRLRRVVALGERAIRGGRALGQLLR